MSAFVMRKMMHCIEQFKQMHIVRKTYTYIKRYKK